ncbi:hypothetical protein F5146DRAFT_729163 [Armillaria mellea]|nr:hypothetical protein F5146DRAFT_729163 [Armillaria mellea]
MEHLAKLILLLSQALDDSYPGDVVQLTNVGLIRDTSQGQMSAYMLILTCHHPRRCQCEQSAIDRWVSHLSVIGSTPVIVERLIAPLDKWKCPISLTSNIKNVDVSATSPVSVVCKPHDFPLLDVQRDYGCRTMFGNDSSQWLHPYHSFHGPHRDTLILKQAIPVGSVGYINPFTRNFVVLSNGIDPASSTDQRIKSIRSLLGGSATNLISTQIIPLSHTGGASVHILTFLPLERYLEHGLKGDQ